MIGQQEIDIHLLFKIVKNTSAIKFYTLFSFHYFDSLSNTLLFVTFFTVIIIFFVSFSGCTLVNASNHLTHAAPAP